MWAHCDELLAFSVDFIPLSMGQIMFGLYCTLLLCGATEKKSQRFVTVMLDIWWKSRNGEKSPSI
jgi:hypothetical protein